VFPRHLLSSWHTGLKVIDPKTAQARDLDVDCFPVRLSGPNLDARHGALSETAWSGLTGVGCHRPRAG
jgi:hypothetical protein